MLLPATFRADATASGNSGGAGVGSGSIVAVNACPSGSRAVCSGSAAAFSAYASGSNDRPAYRDDAAGCNSAGRVSERLFWRFDRRTYPRAWMADSGHVSAASGRQNASDAAADGPGSSDDAGKATVVARFS